MYLSLTPIQSAEKRLCNEHQQYDGRGKADPASPWQWHKASTRFPAEWCRYIIKDTVTPANFAVPGPPLRPYGVNIPALKRNSSQLLKYLWKWDAYQIIRTRLPRFPSSLAGIVVEKISTPFMSLLKSVTLYGLWASGNVAWLYRVWERALISRVRVISDQTLYVVRKDHCLLPQSAKTICYPVSQLLAKVMVWWHTAVLPGSTDEYFRKCCGISFRDFPALKGLSDLTAANFETLPGVRICSVKTSYHHRQVCYFRQTYFHTRSFRLEIRSSKAAQDMRERESSIWWMFRGREGRWRSMLLIFFCMWVRAAELPEDSQMTF